MNRVLDKIAMYGLPVVLYGAGRRAASVLRMLRDLGVEPVCFCDANPKLWGSRIESLPVMGPEAVKKSYPDFLLYLAVGEGLLLTLSHELSRSFCPEDRILNFCRSAYRKSCFQLEYSLMFGTGHMFFCCDGLEHKNSSSAVRMTGDPDADITRLMELKQRTIQDNQKNDVTTFCTGCPNLRYGYWATANTIRFLTFGMFSACQLRCIYCDHVTAKKNPAQHKIKVAEYADVLRQRNLLDKLVHVSFAPGEIVLHPERDDLPGRFANYPATILSNGVIYNRTIAEMIRHPQSALLLSLDAGCRESYLAVKGKDCFDEVAANIKRYREEGGNVVLKYIVLPENNTEKDRLGFYEVCASCSIQSVTISGDCKYLFDQQPPGILEGMAEMIAELRNRGVNAQLSGDIFSPESIARMEEMVRTRIQNKYSETKAQVKSYEDTSEF